MSSWKNVRGKLHCELTIEFLSSGYYTPAQTYGPPENCYPEEGDEERIFDRASIDGKEIPQEVGQKLFDLLTNEIDEVELDYTEDGREWDDE